MGCAPSKPAQVAPIASEPKLAEKDKEEEAQSETNNNDLAPSSSEINVEAPEQVEEKVDSEEEKKPEEEVVEKPDQEGEEMQIVCGEGADIEATGEEAPKDWLEEQPPPPTTEKEGDEDKVPSHPVLESLKSKTSEKSEKEPEEIVQVEVKVGDLDGLDVVKRFKLLFLKDDPKQLQARIDLLKEEITKLHEDNEYRILRVLSSMNNEAMEEAVDSLKTSKKRRCKSAFQGHITARPDTPIDEEIVPPMVENADLIAAIESAQSEEVESEQIAPENCQPNEPEEGEKTPPVLEDGPPPSPPPSAEEMPTEVEVQPVFEEVPQEISKEPETEPVEEAPVEDMPQEEMKEPENPPAEIVPQPSEEPPKEPEPQISQVEEVKDEKFEGDCAAEHLPVVEEVLPKEENLPPPQNDQEKLEEMPQILIVQAQMKCEKQDSAVESGDGTVSPQNSRAEPAVLGGGGKEEDQHPHQCITSADEGLLAQLLEGQQETSSEAAKIEESTPKMTTGQTFVVEEKKPSPTPKPQTPLPEPPLQEMVETPQPPAPPPSQEEVKDDWGAENTQPAPVAEELTTISVKISKKSQVEQIKQESHKDRPPSSGSKHGGKTGLKKEKEQERADSPGNKSRPGSRASSIASQAKKAPAHEQRPAAAKVTRKKK